MLWIGDFEGVTFARRFGKVFAAPCLSLHVWRQIAVNVSVNAFEFVDKSIGAIDIIDLMATCTGNASLISMY